MASICFGRQSGVREEGGEALEKKENFRYLKTRGKASTGKGIH